MNNHYLNVLHLTPGATKSEIKLAYRRLSKAYHPDVSKDENAKAKFIEINEAYKFLTGVGPRPATILSSAPAYDYDIRNHAFDEWRRRAKAYAQQQAKEVARRQHILTKSLLRGFEVVLVVVVIFNLLLIVDSHLPLVAFSNEGAKEQTILRSRSPYYDILKVNNYVLYLRGGELEDVRQGKYERAVVYATPWFNKPIFLDLKIHGREYRFEQYAGIFGFFSFFIKFILLLALLYKVFVRSLDSQLSIAILLLFLSIFQLYLFLKY
ncbi:DnaJ domain-containing protein [Reichenbachiella faecimaris]|uniref:DnaJ domain-containing protein n=1 Tax=Reichenbachiella faecimaris TaxID=692418 RepID=A0A1W2GJ45_REIFA|nr:DnaJ domain-containing protein [Reichenbachiella faecimaris]SMD36296.1 DnaJ domain-containing protein [Reichenbachiella faecimaris]